MRQVLISSVALLGLIGSVFAQGLSDQQIAQKIIAESRQAYYATGHPCACPYDRDRRGHACGGRSAYSRPGGASPKCYPTDITPGDIAKWRGDHAR